jgi:RNA 3'-terminal phosphate cyclase-like protein
VVAGSSFLYYVNCFTLSDACFQIFTLHYTMDVLRFSSHRHLRQRLLLSVLSGRSIRIDGIRSNDVHVGLREYEINLLRLIEKVTNGSTIEISVTGTSFLFHPGVLPGGSFQHTCHVGRSIGYYLEILVPLGPFCKKPLDVMLNGITGEEGRDMTVSHKMGR